MLENYFSAPKTLRRFRGGITGPHIDAFADDLEREGYAPSSAVRYIRAAAHLGCPESTLSSLLGRGLASSASASPAAIPPSF